MSINYFILLYQLHSSLLMTKYDICGSCSFRAIAYRLCLCRYMTIIVHDCVSTVIIIVHNCNRPSFDLNLKSLFWFFVYMSMLLRLWMISISPTGSIIMSWRTCWYVSLSILSFAFRYFTRSFCIMSSLLFSTDLTLPYSCILLIVESFFKNSTMSPSFKSYSVRNKLDARYMWK